MIWKKNQSHWSVFFFPSLKYLKRHLSDDALNVQLKDNFFLYEWAKKK